MQSKGLPFCQRAIFDSGSSWITGRGRVVSWDTSPKDPLKVKTVPPGSRQNESPLTGGLGGLIRANTV